MDRSVYESYADGFADQKYLSHTRALAVLGTPHDSCTATHPCAEAGTTGKYDVTNSSA
jgi:hypothetical protein